MSFAPFKLVLLSNSQIAMVDIADFETVSQYKWHAKVTRHATYAQRNIRCRELKKSRTEKMHRLILNAAKGEIVDHRNGNGLDNRRCNLRRCTHAQNLMNAKKRKGTASAYKGVWNDDGRWVAVGQLGGHRHRIGRYATEEDAALAYNSWAITHFGEFALLNQVKDCDA